MKKKFSSLLTRPHVKFTPSRITKPSATMKLPLTILSVLVLLLAQLPARATDVFFYTPQNVGNISGRAFADAAPPPGVLSMATYGATPNAVSQAIDFWQVGDFTGVISPAPVGNYQRGINNGWYGSTAVQMTDLEMGGQLHTWSIPGGSAYSYNLANLQVQHTWTEADNIRPWTRTTSMLRFQFNLKIPGVYMEGGAVGYIYASLLLKDQNGKFIWLQPQIFDTRGAPSTEYVGWDVGTNSGYANTFYDYNNASRYISKDPWSYWSTSATWNTWRTYSFTVNQTQLLNAVGDMNARYGSGLSTNPAGYLIALFSVQDEIYWPTGNGILQMGVRDLYMYEQY